jgi:hypothetical protein
MGIGKTTAHVNVINFHVSSVERRQGSSKAGPFQPRANGWGPSETGKRCRTNLIGTHLLSGALNLVYPKSPSTPVTR